MKTYSFPQPDGRTLVLTQDPNDPTRYSSRYDNDGSTLADEIFRKVAAGQVGKSTPKKSG